MMAFIAGLVIGSMLGVTVTALCAMGGDCDYEIDPWDAWDAWYRHRGAELEDEGPTDGRP